MNPRQRVRLLGSQGKTYTGWQNPFKEGASLNNGDVWVRQGGTPVNVILDTDFSTDVDDAMDIKACVIYHNEGIANLLGIAVTTSRDHSPGAARAISTFYNQPSIPVASYAPLGTFDPGSDASYIDYLYANFSHSGVGLASATTDTTTAIGSWLSASSGNVVYVMTGFAKALRAYLQSTGGSTLFASKVTKIVAVAGLYPNSGGAPEFNLQQNAADWNWLEANSPVPITWAGIEIGSAIGNVGYTYLNARQPTTDIMRTSVAQWSSSAGVGRPPWGCVGVVYAIQPTAVPFVTVSGSNAINSSTGANTFTAGAGNDKYLTLASVTALTTYIESLVAADGVLGSFTWNGTSWVVVSAGNHSYNVGKISYYAGHYPFIDRMKSGGVGFNGVAFNADGWIPSLAAAQGTYVNCVLNLDPNTGWFPPGNYKIVSTSAATLSVSSSAGISNIVPGVGTATFTASDVGAGNWGSFSLRINVTNNTGSAIAVTDLEVYLVANESLLQAGEIFEPDFLAGLAGAKVLRFADWIGQNDNTSFFRWKFADYGSQNETKASYCSNLLPPFSILMKLAKKVGARPWINLGQAALMEYVSYANTGKKFTAFDPNGSYGAYGATGFGSLGINRFVNDMQVAWTQTNAAAAPFAQGTTYWVVNADATGFSLANTQGGAAIALTSGVDTSWATFNYTSITLVAPYDEYNDMFLPIAQACYAADPSARPIVEYANEVWNSIYSIWGVNKYVTTAMRLGLGESSAYEAIGNMWQSMKCWKAFESVYSAGNVGRVFAWQCVPFSSSTVPQALAFQDPGVYDSSKTFGQIILQAPSRFYYGIAPYLNLDDGNGNNFCNAQNFYVANGNSTTFTQGFWDACSNRGIASYTSTLTTIHNDLTTNLPGTKLCFYEWGGQSVWNISADANWKLVGDSLSAYFESAAGLAMYQRYWSAVTSFHPVDFGNHYFSQGGWVSTTTGFSHWGLRSTNTDTLRSAWWKTQ